MGLFDRKKTSYYDSQPFYTIGEAKTLLVIGLGNPGDKYSGNRHNTGFMTVDKYHELHEFPGWTLKKDLKCEVSIGQVGNTKVILIKPTTFMNNSGESATLVQKFYKIYNTDTITVYDELDVEFGTIRTRTGGGSAGHNGIKSLTAHLGEDYGRIRIGIGPKAHEGMDSADFVLKDFSKEQKEILPKILKEACKFIDEATASNLPEHSVTL